MGKIKAIFDKLLPKVECVEIDGKAYRLDTYAVIEGRKYWKMVNNSNSYDIIVMEETLEDDGSKVLYEITEVNEFLNVLERFNLKLSHHGAIRERGSGYRATIPYLIVNLLIGISLTAYVLYKINYLMEGFPYDATISQARTEGILISWCSVFIGLLITPEQNRGWTPLFLEVMLPFTLILFRIVSPSYYVYFFNAFGIAFLVWVLLTLYSYKRESKKGRWKLDRDLIMSWNGYIAWSVLVLTIMAQLLLFLQQIL